MSMGYSGEDSSFLIEAIDKAHIFGWFIKGRGHTVFISRGEMSAAKRAPKVGQTAHIHTNRHNRASYIEVDGIVYRDER